MIEQAEEELQRLEIEHPDNFHVLKMELKSLISLFQDSLSLLLHNTNHAAGDSPSPSASTAPTRGTVPSLLVKPYYCVGLSVDQL